MRHARGEARDRVGNWRNQGGGTRLETGRPAPGAEALLALSTAFIKAAFTINSSD
jgi:hypothetical protein